MTASCPSDWKTLSGAAATTALCAETVVDEAGTWSQVDDQGEASATGVACTYALQQQAALCSADLETKYWNPFLSEDSPDERYNGISTLRDEAATALLACVPPTDVAPATLLADNRILQSSWTSMLETFYVGIGGTFAGSAHDGDGSGEIGFSITLCNQPPAGSFEYTTDDGSTFLQSTYTDVRECRDACDIMNPCTGCMTG